MTTPQRNMYFEQEVRTASPQRLRLMLIEGAIRQLRLTLDHWQHVRAEQAMESLARARAIVIELLGSVDQTQLPEVTQSVVDVYGFLFRTLATVGLTQDVPAIESALRVLDVERETWLQVCEQMKRVAPPAPHLGHTSNTISAYHAPDQPFSMEA